MQKAQLGARKKGVIAAVLAGLFVAVLVLAVNITEITITGNERYTDEQMTAILFPDKISRNSVFCCLKERLKKHESIPFVEDYKIVFQSPGRVEVIVYEKSVVGYVSYMSSYMYFDKDGIIVESANTRLEGIPWITGLKFGHIVLYQKLPVEGSGIFDEILNLTQILSIYELKVDKIEYNSNLEATLYMDGIEVILGSNESLNGKIGKLNDMLPQLIGKKGTLYLNNYDENDTNAISVFKPKTGGG